ncbi:uncharacterized protein MONBRDRAFT_31084 [Monosiga brevicollis MX1]|uniref:Helicase C-terminal domain-containing protein n=1 Tax=Monosiga brevicollis TaxID=81824 RepID=A9UNM0_MONBE|nr:uncharacterized protein MONBRDRAFT_31084 [Monosiga brevicollis MX1]EDQ92722.1 predicted protein [Monosiga brevicollis MX1]|eukprot:XP_001742484.1 hypothetical protein [Monosiga brevicollis MX1]
MDDDGPSLDDGLQQLRLEEQSPERSESEQPQQASQNELARLNAQVRLAEAEARKAEAEARKAEAEAEARIAELHAEAEKVRRAEAEKARREEKRRVCTEKIKILQSVFCGLTSDHIKTLRKKMMDLADDVFDENVVDLINNETSSEAMKARFPLKVGEQQHYMTVVDCTCAGFSWQTKKSVIGKMPSIAPSQTPSLTAANQLLNCIVAELPCSHHYYAAKIVRHIDELCADSELTIDNELIENLEWAVKVERHSRLSVLQQESDISSRLSIVLRRYFGLDVVHQYSIGNQNTHVDWAGFDDSHHVVVMGECKKAPQNFNEYGGQVANELLRLRAIATRYESGKKSQGLPGQMRTEWPIVNINVVGDYVSAYLALMVSERRWDLVKPYLSQLLPALEGHSLNQDAVSGVFFLRLGCASLSNDSKQVQSILQACKDFVHQELAGLLANGTERKTRPSLPQQPFPCPFEDLHNWKLIESFGPNVQVYSDKKQRKVYKHFDYWGRTDLCSALSNCVAPANCRCPPDDKLLEKLRRLDATGTFYQKWKVTELATAVHVLSYPYVELAHPTKLEQLVQVIRQLEAIHSVDFVHGDILPRNILFCSDWDGHPAAFLIDFDLGRFLPADDANGANRALYVSNYAVKAKALKPYRHDDAYPNEAMDKEHDGFALARVMQDFLEDDDNRKELVAALEELRLDDAATLCMECELLSEFKVSVSGKATGSPHKRMRASKRVVNIDHGNVPRHLLNKHHPEGPSMDTGARSESSIPVEGIPILNAATTCQAAKALRGAGARCVEVIGEESHDASAAVVSENEQELDEQQRFKQLISSTRVMASEAEDERCPHGVHQMHPFYDSAGITLVINELKPERMVNLGHCTRQRSSIRASTPAPDPSSFLGQVLASRGPAVIDATVALRAGLDAEMTKKELVEPLTSLWLALVEVKLSLFDDDKVHFVNVFLLCTAVSKGSGILQDIRQWTTTPAGLLYVFKLFLLRRGKNESWSVSNEFRPYMQPGRLVNFLSQRKSMARTASMAEGQAGVDVEVRTDGDETLRTIVCRGIELNVEELGAALEQMRKDMTEILDKHLLLVSGLRTKYDNKYERLRLKEDRTNRVKNWWVGHGSPAETALFDHIGQTPSLRQEFIQTEHGSSGELTFREDRVRVWLSYVCRFNELALTSTHIAGGLPPRASVYQGLSYKNGVGRQRAAFFAEKQLSILTRVSKTYWLSLNEQHTFRYMDQEISTLIFMVRVRDARNHYNLLFNIAPLQAMVADGLDVLIVTTDMFVRVGSESLHGKVCFQRIRTVVMDEAHTLISDASYRDVMNEVAASVGSGGWTNIKRVALAGTLCIGDQEHLFRKLGQQVGGKVYRLETMRRDLQLRVLHGNQLNFLSHVQAIVDTQRVMRQANGKRVHMMVFCDTVNEVKLLCDQLHARGYVALPYYTDLEEKAQKDHVARWQRGECDVIVATSCLSTGVDLLTIRHVLWYGNGYIVYTLAQAFGRAGRDKQGGTAELWLPHRYQPCFLNIQASGIGRHVHSCCFFNSGSSSGVASSRSKTSSIEWHAHRYRCRYCYHSF